MIRCLTSNSTRQFGILIGVAVMIVMAACRDASSTRDAATVASDAVPASAQSIQVPGEHQLIDVVGHDYAFTMPDTVNAGPSAFRFTNSGHKRHEFNIVLLKPGVTLAQYIDAANHGKQMSQFREAPIGVLFADSAQASPSVLLSNMLAGRTYAVQCIFKDTSSAPSHRELGMFHALTVRNSTSLRRASAVKVDTIVGTDYAFISYPRTLAPGWHEIAFVNTGKQRHEVSIARLRAGKTMDEFMKVSAADGDVNALLDHDYGVLHIESGNNPLGTLGFEIVEGREYVIECAFQDTPTSKPHYEMGMIASIRSTQRR